LSDSAYLLDLPDDVLQNLAVERQVGHDLAELRVLVLKHSFSHRISVGGRPSYFEIRRLADSRLAAEVRNRHAIGAFSE
jgi:hypothetical protein